MREKLPRLANIQRPDPVFYGVRAFFVGVATAATRAKTFNALTPLGGGGLGGAGEAEAVEAFVEGGAADAEFDGGGGNAAGVLFEAAADQVAFH